MQMTKTDYKALQGVYGRFEHYCRLAERASFDVEDSYHIPDSNIPPQERVALLDEGIQRFSMLLRQSLAAHNENGYFAEKFIEKALDIRNALLSDPVIQTTDEIRDYLNTIIVPPTGNNPQTSLFGTDHLHNGIRNFKRENERAAKAAEPETLTPEM